MARKWTQGDSVSERQLWRHVESTAELILTRVQSGAVARMAEDLRGTAMLALEQLEAGVHKNPARLAMYALGNPPRRLRRLGHPEVLTYQHDEDGKHYRHAFGQEVEMFVVGDSALIIQRPDGGRIVGDF